MHHGYQHEHAQVHRPPAYWRRQVRRKAAKVAAAEQETIPAEQAQHIDDPEVILGPVAEKATNIEENTNAVAEKLVNTLNANFVTLSVIGKMD